MFYRMEKIIAIVAMLGLMLGTQAFGESSCGDAAGYEKMGKRMFRGLDLSDGQKEQMKRYFKNTKETEKAIRDEMKAAKGLLREEFKKEDPSSGEVKGIVVKMKDLSDRAIEEKVNSMIRMREILTAEQYRKFMGKIEKHGVENKHRNLRKKAHKDLG